jgi:hypothetical protein
MNYEDLSGEMPLARIVEALDDDRDGQADEAAWAAVQASAEERVLDAFGGAVPERCAGAVARARKVFLLDLLYTRRGFGGADNPFGAQAVAAEKRLRSLSAGDEAPAGTGGGTVYSEPAKVAGTTGLMA